VTERVKKKQACQLPNISHKTTIASRTSEDGGTMTVRVTGRAKRTRRNEERKEATHGKTDPKTAQVRRGIPD
jgi:hypothetical protein